MTGYSDSTPLALSNDTNSFRVIEKKYRENSDGFFSIETSVERPHEFAYARMSHDRVQPPLHEILVHSILVQHSEEIPALNDTMRSVPTEAHVHQ